MGSSRSKDSSRNKASANRTAGVRRQPAAQGRSVRTSSRRSSAVATGKSSQRSVRQKTAGSRRGSGGSSNTKQRATDRKPKKAQLSGANRRSTSGRSSQVPQVSVVPPSDKRLRSGKQAGSDKRLRSGKQSASGRQAKTSNRRPQPYSAPAKASAPLRSVRVSDVQRNAHAAAKKPASSLRKVLIGILIALVLAVIAFVVVITLNLFPVKKVTVSGISHLNEEQLTELAAVPQDSTLINVDASGIESRLKTNSWVQDVQVERVLPDTINLNITERRIAAVVEVLVDDAKTTETWALGSDGVWIMKIPDRNSEEGKQIPEQIYSEADSVLKISQVPYGSVPEAGTWCNNANINNALGIIEGMTTQLAQQVKQVNASSSESTTLILQNGVEIAFGDSSNIRDKERVCLALLEAHSGDISYINVRDASKPVWRSI